LEVVAAQPARYVDDFSDEIEVGAFFGLHGFGVELVGRDASGGDFGFDVALGAGGGDAPVVEALFEGDEGGVGEGVVRRGVAKGLGGLRGEVEGEPAFGHAGGEDVAEFVVDGGGVAASMGGEEEGGDVLSGGEVEGDGLAGLPVGGGLEDGGAAEAAVGDEELFTEGGG